MGLLRRRSPIGIHHVTIRVNEPKDMLKRIAILHTAMVKILSGTRLIRVLSADYESGCIEMLVEADAVKPSIVPGHVEIEVEAWPV